jgi:hypothetical protein
LANAKTMTLRTVTTCNWSYTSVKELAKTTSKIQASLRDAHQSSLNQPPTTKSGSGEM